MLRYNDKINCHRDILVVVWSLRDGSAHARYFCQFRTNFFKITFFNYYSCHNSHSVLCRGFNLLLTQQQPSHYTLNIKHSITLQLLLFSFLIFLCYFLFIGFLFCVRQQVRKGLYRSEWLKSFLLECQVKFAKQK